MDTGFHIVNESIDASSSDPIRQGLLQLVVDEANRRSSGRRFNAQESKGDLLRVANRLRHELHVRRVSRVRVVDWLEEEPIEIQLQRDHFDQLLQPAICSGIQTAEVCLSRVKCGWEHVEKIILLGELASFPAVVQGISARSGKSPGDVLGRNSELAVAAGASIIGTAIKPSESRKAQFDVGLRVLRWQPSESVEDRFVIASGTPLPSSVTSQYYTRSRSQNLVLLEVLCKKKDGTMFVVGEAQVGPLPGPRRGYPLDVTVTMNNSHQVILSIRDGILGIVDVHHFDPLSAVHPASADRQILRRLESNR
jgi:molecular chaperone DnaK (HSP70)